MSWDFNYLAYKVPESKYSRERVASPAHLEMQEQKSHLPFSGSAVQEPSLEHDRIANAEHAVARGMFLALQSQPLSDKLLSNTSMNEVLAVASEANDDSVLPLIEGLKAGDAIAVGALANRYFDRVVGIASRLHRTDRPLRANGPEDVAASVFGNLWRKSIRGKFSGAKLSSRDDFWRLLSRMVARKSIDHIRREHAAIRGGGKLRGESAFLERALSLGDQRPVSIDSVPCRAILPDEYVEYTDSLQNLMKLLKCDDLREIASLRLSGYAVKEIAAKLSVSDRSIQRKLELIRKAWAVELHRDS